jgi:hypothetical protein
MAWMTMVFITYLFVFYFLPLVLVFYYALKGFCRQAGAPNGRTCLVLNTLLVLASYIFYGWWNPWFVFLMLGITVECLQVVQSDNRTSYRDVAESEVLNLGDSFLRIYERHTLR